MLIMKPTLVLFLSVSVAAALGATARAADVTARDVTAALYRATAAEPIDYSNKDLSYLDLSEIDFKGALLTRANLFGSDFTGANLRNVNLVGARLDRTTIIRADFSGANLAGATMLVPAAFVTLANARLEAPKFTGATLTRFRANGEYWRVDFRGADLSDADFSPHSKRFGDTTIAVSRRTSFRSCDFSGAKLVRANLSRILVHFSIFAGADMRDADLSDADFSKANLSGADLTGADITKANFDGADLRGVRGLDQARGADQALNLHTAVRE
jgi:uncharacterized protein YjbI with pentapeptide repeats